MDKAGNHHFQQSDTRTENQTLHVLIQKWVLNNENTWTLGGAHYTLWSVGGWGARGGTSRHGDWGGVALGEIPNVDDRAMDAANHHHGTYIPM